MFVPRCGCGSRLPPIRWMPKSLVAHITVDELRQIILEGAVEAAKALVPSAGKP